MKIYLIVAKHCRNFCATSWNHVFLLSNTQYDTEWSRSFISFRVVIVVSASDTSYSRSVNPAADVVYRKRIDMECIGCWRCLFLHSLTFTLIKQAESQRPRFGECNYTRWMTVIEVLLGSLWWQSELRVLFFFSSSCDSWEVISHLIATPAPTQQVKQTW